ncbi:hypothetical protein SB679_25740, partial [Chryseobacterium sp. SIMBA_029]
SRNVASSGELVVLKANVESLDGRVHELSQAQTKQPAVPPSKPKAAVRKARPAQKPSTSVITPQAPPFTIVGIEYRGGERF